MGKTNRKFLESKKYHIRLNDFLSRLEQGDKRTIDQWAAHYGVSRKSIYNYITHLNSMGNRIDTNQAMPVLVDTDGCHYQAIEFFIPPEEAAQMMYLITSLSSPQGIQHSLCNTMMQDLKEALAPYFSTVDGNILCVGQISQAMRHHKQLLIKGYSSSNSGSRADRRVEPVQWSHNYRQLYAYDLDKLGMRTFAVERMEGAEPLAEDCVHQDQYHVPECDCFWMSGALSLDITLRLSMRALNLLHEEYPLSRKVQVTEDSQQPLPYTVTLHVCALEGIGRFVMGLASEIEVLDCPQLIDYCRSKTVFK